LAQQPDCRFRKILGPENSGPLRIVNIVIDIRGEISHTDNLPLESFGSLGGWHAHRRPALPLGMVRDAVAHFPREVQSLTVIFEDVDNSQALLIVVESAGYKVIEYTLASVPERGMTQVVSQRDSLGQLLVELQHLGNRPGNLGNFERVRQPRSIVIAGRREKDLRLVFQPAKSLRVDDPVPIPLKRRTHVVFRLIPQPAAGLGAFCRLGRQDLSLACLEMFTNARHEYLRCNLSI
jgi:hypothetical protein